MLKAAETRKIYDELIEGDVMTALSSAQECYDLILAGDMLIYVGDLSQFMPAVARRLKPGGLFAFSVESYEGNGFFLHPSSRFSHSVQYVRDVAAASNLKELSAASATLRRNYGKDVAAWIVVLEKP
jgi:predicted TPR repeat methyltransferase